MVTPPPPPPTTDPGIVFPVCPGRGRKTKTPKFLEFPVSKNPKNPTQVSDFWKLERGPQNPKIELPFEFPKIQKCQPKFRIFGNSSGSLSVQGKGAGDPQSQIPRVSKNPKFRIFGNSSGSPKIQNSSSRSSFQKPKPWGGVFGFLEFRKLERELDFWILEFPLDSPKIQTLGCISWIFGISETRPGAPFLDFGVPARVSKNPNLGVDTLDFWFGFLETRAGAPNPRIELPIEFPKFQKSKISTPRFGFLDMGAAFMGYVLPLGQMSL